MKVITTAVMFFSILLMSIGYSAFNSTLTISGVATAEGINGIEVTNVYIKEATEGAYEAFSPEFTVNSSLIGVVLPNENSQITFIVEITNYDNYYYHISAISNLLSNNANIKYEVLDEKILYFHPNTVTEIEVTFSYETYSTTEQSISLELGYVFKRITYKNLDYVVYSGVEYIDTGLSNTGDYIFETSFNQTAYNQNDGGWIISGRTIAAYTLGVFNGKTGVYNGYGGTTSPKSPHITLNTWYDLYFSRIKHTIGNYSYSVNGRIIIPSEYETTVRIGGATAGYNGGIDLRHFIGYIGNVKITDAEDGEVLKYYIPAEIIEGDNIGEIGYWDIINNVFCGNDGTGAFLAP